MLKIKYVTFENEETGNLIEVCVDGTVKSKEKCTIEEAILCKLHTGFLLEGGLEKAKKKLFPDIRSSL